MANDLDDVDESSGEEGLLLESSEENLSDDGEDVYQHLLNTDSIEEEIEEEPTDE